MKAIISILALTLSTTAFAADVKFCSEGDRGVQVEFSQDAQGQLMATLFVVNDNGRIALEDYKLTSTTDAGTTSYEGVNSDRSTSKFSLKLGDDLKGELTATVLGQEIRSGSDSAAKPQLTCKTAN